MMHISLADNQSEHTSCVHFFIFRLKYLHIITCFFVLSVNRIWIYCVIYDRFFFILSYILSIIWNIFGDISLSCILPALCCSQMLPISLYPLHLFFDMCHNTKLEFICISFEGIILFTYTRECTKQNFYSTLYTTVIHLVFA